MTTSFNNIVDIAAFMEALAQQPQSLPEALQLALHEIGPAVQANDRNGLEQLRNLISQHPPLEQAYRQALRQKDSHYTAQERSKSLGQTFPPGASCGLIFVQDVIPSEDWVQSVHRFAVRQRTKTSGFGLLWNNLSRVAVMAIGGSFIGGMVAQLLGSSQTVELVVVLLGVVVGIICAWYVSRTEAKSSRI